MHLTGSQLSVWSTAVCPLPLQPPHPRNTSFRKMKQGMNWADHSHPIFSGGAWKWTFLCLLNWCCKAAKHVVILSWCLTCILRSALCIYWFIPVFFCSHHPHHRSFLPTNRLCPRGSLAAWLKIFRCNCLWEVLLWKKPIPHRRGGGRKGNVIYFLFCCFCNPLIIVKISNFVSLYISW